MHLRIGSEQLHIPADNGATPTANGATARSSSRAARDMPLTLMMRIRIVRCAPALFSTIIRESLNLSHYCRLIDSESTGYRIRAGVCLGRTLYELPLYLVNCPT